MSGRMLHRTWNHVRRYHLWYFLVLTLLFGTVAVRELKHNNEQMGRLREAVFVADKENKDVEGALRNLREYVYGHMNTSLASGPNAPHPPIQLQYTYERLQAAQQQTLGGNNSNLYTQALQECQQEGQTISGQAAINCIESYAAAHGIQLADIPDALYKFDFRAARWSPDLAGWSVLLTVLFGAATVMSALYYAMFTRHLR